MERLLGWAPGRTLAFPNAPGLPAVSGDTQAAERFLGDEAAAEQYERIDGTAKRLRVSEDLCSHLPPTLLRSDFYHHHAWLHIHFSRVQGDSKGEEAAVIGALGYDEAVRLADDCAAMGNLHDALADLPDEMLLSSVLRLARPD